jgi:hypothetical protein
MPLSVLIPAPVSTTTRSAASSQDRAAVSSERSRSSTAWIVPAHRRPRTSTARRPAPSTTVAAMAEDPTAEVTALLQALIRNACVNDGDVASGGETRSVEVIAEHLGTSGLDVERYEPAPGRGSLLARIEGTDPSAPTLLLLGHTDVVPANAERWRHDPFGGEIIRPTTAWTRSGAAARSTC